jgi:hypothetical protein
VHKHVLYMGEFATTDGVERELFTEMRFIKNKGSLI